MFIRKKRNKSGSISFHIVRKEGRKQIHIKSIGTARESQQILNLEAKAHQELLRLRQQGVLALSFQQDEAFFTLVSEGIQKIEIATW